ncbi:MAG TPA: SBBP repeat-containing protein [Blastocatellia bacterium]|nr:SBBP repeat-containing protein [Blastocatellia bacterium]HNG30880.1 SBBP repeat-containing protein [Blastocatellia bacterium]
MSRFFFAGLLALLATSVTGNEVFAQTFAWAQFTNGTHGKAVGTDSAGNSYVIGDFTSSVTFPGLTLTASQSGAIEGFLAKYDSNGGFQWARQISGISTMSNSPLEDPPTHGGLFVSSTGDIYITGTTYGYGNSVTFKSKNSNDNKTVQSTSKWKGLFLIRYDNQGNIKWLKQATCAKGSVWGRGVTADNNNNIYITGAFDEDVVFENGAALSANNAACALIAKYDQAGNLQWVKKAVGGSETEGRAIAFHRLNGNEALYVTGHFAGNLTIGSINTGEGGQSYASFKAKGKRDAFLAKFLPSTGEFVWAQQGGFADPNSITTPNGIVAFNTGVYITGIFYKATQFGSFKVSGLTKANYFIAGFSLAGGVTYYVRGAGSNTDESYGFGICLDNKGTFYVTGMFKGTMIIDGKSITSAGNRDIFIARYNISGHALWLAIAGGTTETSGTGGADWGASISTDNLGSVWITGFANGKDAAFGTIKATARDFFIAKMKGY